MTDTPPSRCERCGGNETITVASGATATARPCSCIDPCPSCGGSGFHHRMDEFGYVYVAACECEARLRRIARFAEATIPAKFFDRTLFNFEPASDAQAGAQSAVYQFLRNYQDGGRGFLLMGPVGTGKTHLMCAALAHLCLESGVTCRFVDFFQLLHDLRDGFAQHRSAAELLGPLEEVPVLAVDELGKGKNTEWELSILDELISSRYNQRRTTLFTTNYTDDRDTTFSLSPGATRGGGSTSRLERKAFRETLEERIGPRIYSRLKEMCSFHLVTGPDYRNRNAD